MAEKEYIDRQSTVDALARLCKRVCQYSEKQRQFMCGACPLGDAFTVIEDDLPAADVRPVVKARWNVGADGWECSNCAIESNNTYPICPYCGADMRGGKLMDELVKRLHRYTENCVAYKLDADFASAVQEAADAIEELSAKATPKRVGFTGWHGCRDTRYKCPYCNKYVRNDETYCHKCGQALMFPRISHTPYVPGKKQDVIVTWPDEPPKEET